MCHQHSVIDFLKWFNNSIIACYKSKLKMIFPLAKGFMYSEGYVRLLLAIFYTFHLEISKKQSFL